MHHIFGRHFNVAVIDIFFGDFWLFISYNFSVVFLSFVVRQLDVEPLVSIFSRKFFKIFKR